MGRTPEKVDKGTAREWYERYRNGESFKDIGADYQRDRRFVSRIVKDYEKEVKTEETTGERAMSDVRTAYLQDHLQTLESCAKYILELTIAPSVIECLLVDYSGGSDLDVGSKLVGWIEWKRTPPSYQGLLPHVAAAYIQLPSPSVMAIEARMARREGQQIVAALKEHLPELWEQVESWTDVATQYEKAWKELEYQARGKDIERELFQAGLSKALELVLGDGQAESMGPPAKEIKTDLDIALWLYRTPKTRELLEQFQHHKDTLESAYADLEDMISSVRLRKDLLARQCKYCPVAKG